MTQRHHAGACSLRIRQLAGVVALAATLAAASMAGPAARADQPTLLTGVAMPAVSLEGSAANVPAVLSTADADRYRRIFSLQEDGDMRAADGVIRELKDPILMGHVLEQRYLHPTAYKSSYDELRKWMAKYADHPDAQRIYDLALRRKPRKLSRPQRPTGDNGSLLEPPPRHFTYESDKKLTASQRRRVASLKRRIRRDVQRTRLSKTERLLASAEVRRLFDRFEIDEGYEQVSAAWYYYGNDRRAYDLASAAAARSGRELPLLHWTAGLAAWRLGSYDTAAKHFSALASAHGVSDWNIASGAYWAARAHEKRGRAEEARRWLEAAARYPTTLYGLIARKRLNMPPPFKFATVPQDDRRIAPLLSHPKGRRALALIQAGQAERAEQELMTLSGWRESRLAQALLAVSQRASLAGLGYRLATRILQEDWPGWTEARLEGILYPVPSWRPSGGYVLDRALIFAKMRQESGFYPFAKSPAGAHGLMQLMPSTASYLTGDRSYRRRSGRRELFDPEYSIELGQRYLVELLQSSAVGGDLFRLAVAYNAGPGNLAKWERETKFGGDPLLFIESIPSLETRLFVERVLANLWVYRARFGQATPTLDAVARGRWPRYQGLDRR